MKVGSLFSGIGGLDLGLERAGMTVAWQSEIDPYACKVLEKHWPTVPNLGDITLINWSTVEHVDLICGGYPCQPFSLAGVRQGENDPRHLWPHFATALRHLRPRWALLENVPGHLSLGFGRVLGDLADLGYDTDWDCIPAAAVGAPHLRYRVFVVAHTGSPRRRQNPGSTSADETTDEGRSAPHDHVVDGDGQSGRTAHVAHTNGQGESDVPVDAVTRPRLMVPDTDNARCNEQRRSDASRTKLATAELDRWWSVEPDVGRVAHGIPARVDRLRCLGNAVVPQVAEWIGHQIMQAAA